MVVSRSLPMGCSPSVGGFPAGCRQGRHPRQGCRMGKRPGGATDVQSAGEESEGSLGKALTQGLVILEERGRSGEKLACISKEGQH